jgi:hypothetical protein
VRGRAAARWLLVLFVAAGTVYVAGLLGRLVPARPEIVEAFAVLPLGALALAVWARARGLIVVALVELLALVPLHALITFVRAWRLEGG